MSEEETPDAYLRSGIPGLDTVLTGGFLRGGIYIVQGTPGTGKTIFGNQLCFNHAARGGKALYVTLLAESHSRMLMHMNVLSFFDPSAIPDRVYYVSAFQELEQNGVGALIDLLRREVRRHGADVLVLDGLVAVETHAGGSMQFKKFIHELQVQATVLDCTMFLLTSAGSDLPTVAEHTMVDGVMVLANRLHGWRTERDLQVLKRRGRDYLQGRHAFRITQAGIVVYPRVEGMYALPSRTDRVDGPPLPTGIEGFDELIGGGLPAHSTTLLLGSAGSGKTTFGLQFLSGGGTDSPGLLVGFHETAAGLRAKCKALELAFSEGMDQGRVEVMWTPTTEGLIDQTCAEMLTAVDRRGVRRLFIDGLEAFQRLASDPARVDPIFAAFAAELRARNVTTVYTAEAETLVGGRGGSPMAGISIRGVSGIAENILLMRFLEVRSSVYRVISVLKARDSRIDNSLRLFEITQGGIVIDASPEAAERILQDALGTWLQRPTAGDASAPPGAPGA
ncbi:MAG: Non-specific serine/threonine protein kinase [Caulobacteraceae bacterium]|nr:Non-specific serine/threonine protein kinase [Caulobacteraceae bacterium]